MCSERGVSLQVSKGGWSSHGKLEEQPCHPYQLLVWSAKLFLQRQHDCWEDHTEMTGQSVTSHRREESQHPSIDRWCRQLGKKDSVNLMTRTL